jgi:glyoxalase family protein
MSSNPDSTSGLHHITAMASDPQRNLDFYGELLGLRLVKRTVNFDDPGTYHFYFGDHDGSPGTLLTFFPWPGAGPGTVGSGEAAAISFAIAPDSVDPWIERLSERGLTPEVGRRFGATLLGFDDPDGLRLELIADPDAAPLPAWERSPVPEEQRLRGLFGATLLLADGRASAELLARFGYAPAGDEDDPRGPRRRYRVAGNAPGTHLDLITLGHRLPARLGAGSVHHLALRTPDDAEQRRHRERLTAQGSRVTTVQDRYYFRSIYFREPGGVLLEIATDGPGFTVDEPLDELGLALKLPPLLEPDRDTIRARLPQVLPPEYAALFGGRGLG